MLGPHGFWRGGDIPNIEQLVQNLGGAPGKPEKWVRCEGRMLWGSDCHTYWQRARLCLQDGGGGTGALGRLGVQVFIRIVITGPAVLGAG